MEQGDRLEMVLGSTLGVAFSPGGLLFPYHVGIGYALQRAGVITDDTPLAGSSAGSIVATILAAGADEDAVLEATDRLVDDVRAGTKLNPALRKELRRMLPPDAAERCSGGRLTLMHQRVLPWPRAVAADSFADADDLIDCICASCNWPFFFSRWPLVWCRGGLAVDGFFALPRTQFGCPQIADETLRVISLPKVEVEGGDALVLQPQRSDDLELPVPTSEWFSWALEPAPDLGAVHALGRAHAEAWLAANDRF